MPAALMVWLAWSPKKRKIDWYAVQRQQFQKKNVVRVEYLQEKVVEDIKRMCVRYLNGDISEVEFRQMVVVPFIYYQLTNVGLDQFAAHMAEWRYTPDDAG